MNNLSKKEISFEELASGCFSRVKVKSVNAGGLRNGVKVVKVIYRHEPNIYGEQVIWFLYNRDLRRVEKVLDKLRVCFKGMHDTFCFIDHYEDYFSPTRSNLALDIMISSDGLASSSVHTLTLPNGIKGYVGVIVGQGRDINFEEEGVLSLIHVILSSVLPASRTRNDPFIKAGQEKVKQFIETQERESIKLEGK